jgi:peptidoglycan biosynthesis protein MviN/MurJ (putative lipid II flippase)
VTTVESVFAGIGMALTVTSWLGALAFMVIYTLRRRAGKIRINPWWRDYYQRAFGAIMSGILLVLTFAVCNLLGWIPQHWAPYSRVFVYSIVPVIVFTQLAALIKSRSEERAPSARDHLHRQNNQDNPAQPAPEEG